MSRKAHRLTLSPDVPNVVEATTLDELWMGVEEDADGRSDMMWSGW